jgi:hypothetical protein
VFLGIEKDAIGQTDRLNVSILTEPARRRYDDVWRKIISEKGFLYYIDFLQGTSFPNTSSAEGATSLNGQTNTRLSAYLVNVG